jgi:hypothetical protein
MSITTYLPTRVHTDATGRAVSNAAGRLVRGWRETNPCSIATKRFRIVDYTDGDVVIPAGAVCKTSTDTLWDGTFPYKDPYVWQWQAAASGNFQVSGYKMQYNGLYILLSLESSIGAGWPAAVPALTDVSSAGVWQLMISCEAWSGYGYCWRGIRAQRQIVAGVDQFCHTAAGTYIRFDGYTNDPAQLEIEEY